MLAFAIAPGLAVQSSAGAVGVIRVTSYSTSTFGPIGLVEHKGTATFTSLSPAIADIQSDGTVSTFTTGLNTGSRPMAIASGTHGTHWFVDRGTTPAIGEISKTGAITEYSSGLSAGEANPLVRGPDGNMWFGQCDAIGRITAAGHISEYTSGLPSGVCVTQLVDGANGAIWFYAEAFNQSATPEAPALFGQITTSGSISTHQGPVGVTSLVPNPKGGVWFTVSTYASAGAAVGRVTSSGTVKLFSGLNSGSNPETVVAVGNDAWFVDEGTTPALGELTPSGAVTEFSVGLPTGSSLSGIAFDAGSLWSCNRGTTPGVVTITTSGSITQDSSGLPSGFGALCGQVVPSGPTQLWVYSSANPGVVGNVSIG